MTRNSVRIASAAHSIPTNVPGIYTWPAPPPDLDLITASPPTLIKHGLHWLVPQADDHPSLVAFREQFLSRHRFLHGSYVTHFEPQPGRTHALRRLPTRTDAGNVTGTQWSGGVLMGPWNAVASDWIVPAISKPANDAAGTNGGWDSSMWIGIDGYITTTDVLQTGIEMSVDSSGTPTYIPWIEWYVPPPPPPCPDSGGCDSNGYPLSWVGPSGKYQYIHQSNYQFQAGIKPGNSISAYVEYTINPGPSDPKTYMYLINNTTHDMAVVWLAPPPGAAFSGSCVEWIVEQPDGGYPTTVLPEISIIQFLKTACWYTVPPTTTMGNLKNGIALDIQNGAKLLTQTNLDGNLNIVQIQRLG